MITGGSGYLGAELVHQAAQQGRDVAATYYTQRAMSATESASGTTPPGSITWHHLDVRDQRDTADSINRVRPAVIIHTAYRQDGPDLHAITALGAEHVAHAAQSIGARLIHLSSDVIFDGEADRPYTETDPPTPISAYGAAKAESERLVAQACPGALIVRTSLIYGGAQVSKHEQLALDAADGKADIAFFTDEIRCPIVVADLARALLELADLDLGGVLHVAGADAVSRYQFACLVAAAHGRTIARLRAASSLASGLRRPRNCRLAIQYAGQILQTQLRGITTVLSPGGRS